MVRKFFLLSVILCGFSGQLLAQDSGSPLVSEIVARQHGLTRAWFTHIDLDRAADHIIYITQDKGMLFVQCQRATVHALMAETGRAVWSEQIGLRNHPGFPPGANDRYVAIINGLKLYVVNRADGRQEWQRKIDGPAGSGPALTDTRVYVPLASGMMQAFSLEDRKEPPWSYRSAGRLWTQPMVTPNTVSWTTNKGYYYAADAHTSNILYRLETRDSIRAEPAYWPPYLYACSTDGEVYCVAETTGRIAWRFQTGDAIVEPPVAINGKLYIVSHGGSMSCLDGATGERLWVATGVSQFVAGGASKIYAVDQLKRLSIFNGKSGAHLDTMRLPQDCKKVINDQTDRIYLVAETGLIQCLREIELKTPLVYSPPKDDLKTRSAAIAGKIAEKKKVAAGEADTADETGATDEAATTEEDKPAEEDNLFGQ